MRGDRARGAVGAAHHRRVEQHEAALVEHRAAPGVEHRVVLEHDHRGLGGVQRVAAVRQHRVAGLHGPLHALASRVMALARQFPAPPWTTISTAAKIKGQTLYLRQARDDLPVGRRGERAVARGAGRFEAAAVEPAGADDDRRADRRRVEVAQRQVESPGDERTGERAGADACAAHECLAPARGGDHAVERRGRVGAVREVGDLVAQRAERSWRARRRRGSRRRRRPRRGPLRRRPARRRARPRRPGSAGCRRSPPASSRPRRRSSPPPRRRSSARAARRRWPRSRPRPAPGA